MNRPTPELLRGVREMVASCEKHSTGEPWTSAARALLTEIDALTSQVRERDDLVSIIAKRLGCTGEWHDVTETLAARCRVFEAARAWAAVESETPQPSSTGVADWAERRAAARDALLAAVGAAS